MTTPKTAVESLVQRVVERNLVFVSPQIFPDRGPDGAASVRSSAVQYQYGMYDRSYGRYYCQENPLDSVYYRNYNYQCPVHARYLPQIPLKKYYTADGEYIYRVREVENFENSRELCTFFQKQVGKTKTKLLAKHIL